MADAPRIVDCSMAKVYKLFDKPSGNLIYVGSTTRELRERFREHLKGIRDPNNSKYDLARLYKIDDIDIALLELYPCDNVKQLRERECFYIKQYLGIGVQLMNKAIPGRTVMEYRKDHLQEYQEYQRRYQSQWKQRNPNYQQQWRASHPGYSKQYYAANRERILAKRKEKEDIEPSA